MRQLQLILMLLVGSTALAQKDIPYEPKGNFTFEIDYTFKNKPPVKPGEVSFVEPRNRQPQLLPYLKINFGFGALPSKYYRIRVEDGSGKLIRSKKLKQPDTYILDMGYSDDLKDRVTPNKYIIFFQTKEKVSISKIEVEVQENGDLLLNGSFHGRI